MKRIIPSFNDYVVESDVRSWVQIPKNAHFDTSDIEAIKKELKEKKIRCASEISKYKNTMSWMRIQNEDFKTHNEFIMDIIKKYKKD